MLLKKGFLKPVVCLLVFAGLAAIASAQVTISGGFALSSMSVKTTNYSMDGGIGYGGNVYVDYLLPIGIPLSLGFEVGYDTASLTDKIVEYDGYASMLHGYAVYNEYEDTVTGIAIPLLARVAYHFDLMQELDLYLVGKIGYVLGFVDQHSPNSQLVGTRGYNGIGFGFDLGVAYYFTSNFGIFAEAGFDRYDLKKEESGYKMELPFSRFATFGISAKF